MRRQSVALFVWLAMPVLVVAALIWAISVAQPMRDRVARESPPVGAGAGNTGGANAVGELLAGQKANHGTPEGRAEEAPPARPAPPRVEPSAPVPQAAGGTIRTLEVRGGAAGAADTTRVLQVWLPPGYDDPRNAGVQYPVLYLHDGQNLFGDDASKWRADVTAADLIRKEVMRPVILVGIPHSGATRVSEYLPIPALQGVKPEGDAHVAWLVGEVMPKVEGAFRVLRGPESTGIGGSSLGAAVALHAATKHPDRFGILLAESLPLRTGDGAAWDAWLAGVRTWPRRVYLGIGGVEAGTGVADAGRSAEYVAAVQGLDQRLRKAGLGPDRRLLVVDPAAGHNEAAWAKRLPQALTFLFPPPVDPTK